MASNTIFAVRAEVPEVTVTEDNAAAMTLYESLGFKNWGIEPSALNVGGTGSRLDPEIEPMGNLANDCGLYDEDGRARPSLDIWSGWLAVPRQ